MRARIAMTRQFSACRQAPRTAGSRRAEEVLRKVRVHSRQTGITELAELAAALVLPAARDAVGERADAALGRQRQELRIEHLVVPDHGVERRHGREGGEEAPGVRRPAGEEEAAA